MTEALQTCLPLAVGSNEGLGVMPPLPEPWIAGGVLHAPIEGAFTASQMRDYAAAAVAAERARQRKHQLRAMTQAPAAWRYWKDKFGCWEYSDTRLEFPAVPCGTEMEPLFLIDAARRSMTQAQIDRLVTEFHRTRRHHGGEPADIVRAVETFHGIRDA